MMNWTRKIALMLILALLAFQYPATVAAMEDYPRTSSAMCAVIEQDMFISNPEDFGCKKRSSESRRADQCIPVFDEERQTRGQACPFLKAFGKPSLDRILG